MLRIIKADIYRMVRGKGVYITLAFILLLLILTAAGNAGRVGVNVDNANDMVEYNTASTGKDAAFKAMAMTDNMAYLLLAILIIIAGVDFSEKSIKNVLSGGISRSKYYFSKWILAMIVVIIVMILNIIVPMITGTVINGFGGSIDSSYIGDLLMGTGLQFILMAGIVTFGIFLIFATRKSGAVIGGYIAFCMLPMLIVYILSEINAKFENLYTYDIISNMRLAADPSSLANSDITRIIMIGIVCTGIFLAGGMAIFRKCEIK